MTSETPTPNSQLPSRRKVGHTFALAIIGAFSVFIATVPFIGIFLWTQNPPVAYSRREILTPQVYPGEPLRIRIAADVATNCDATVMRVIRDASGRRHGFDPEHRPHEPEYVVEIITPLEAWPGPAAYLGTVAWSCNFVQRWFPRVIIQRELPFTILAPEGWTPPYLQQQTPPIPPIEETQEQYERRQGMMQQQQLKAAD